MKYVLLVLDGAADRPIPELGDKTPLQTAKKPHLDELAKQGQSGLLKTCPDDVAPGSDTANLSLLGYDPKKYFSGRAPLEAANIGIDLKPNQVAFRCNLVTVKDEKMLDYSAGHISTGEAKLLIEMLEKRLSTKKIHFYPGVGYRHLMVWEGGPDQLKCMPPHDIMGRPIEDNLPQGTGKKFVCQLMKDSQLLLEGHEVNWRRRREKLNTANMIWLWGSGKKPTLPLLTEKYKITGSVISAVDLVKGIGIYAGLKVLNVPGATGYLDTNYAGKCEYALKALKKEDFVWIHVEAPDEAGHNGDAASKIKAIEDIDEKIVGPLVEGLKKLGDYRIVACPDHPTPISTRTHNNDKVPFLIAGAGVQPDGVSAFDEQSALAGSLQFDQGWNMMDYFISLTKD